MRLIDADALWKKFSVNPNTGERYRTRDCDNFPVTVNLEAVQREIRCAPTVDYVKCGRWHDVYMISRQTVTQTCSCCQNSVVMNIANVFHFCPACGAKMDTN